MLCFLVVFFFLLFARIINVGRSDMENPSDHQDDGDDAI